MDTKPQRGLASRWRLLIVGAIVVVVCLGVAVAGPLEGGRLDPRTWFEPSLAELNAQAKSAAGYERPRQVAVDVRAAGCQCSVESTEDWSGGVRSSTLAFDSGDGPETVTFYTIEEAEVPPSLSVAEVLNELFKTVRRETVTAEDDVGGLQQGGTLWLVGPTWITYGGSDPMRRLQEILGGELRPR